MACCSWLILIISLFIIFISLSSNRVRLTISSVDIRSTSSPNSSPSSQIALSSNVVAILILMLTNSFYSTQFYACTGNTGTPKLLIDMANNKVTILNEGELLKNGATRSAVELSKDLQKIMLKMKGSFMSTDGHGVDYNALKNSQLFEEYQKSARDLQRIQLSGLTSSEKTAFFLNIYNALTIHGLAECQALPSSVLEINNFWRQTAYSIGGHVLSLDDIEHGILRGNQPHPSNPTPLFLEGDPRRELALTEVDPRIHFALVCGAKSCPAINVYSENNLQQGLTAAARSFCAQEVEINGTVVTLSKIFIWYRQDFASTDTALLRWITQYLPSEKKLKMIQLINQLENGEAVDIKAKEYNWNLNKL